jgi:hypothetical protein
LPNALNFLFETFSFIPGEPRLFFLQMLPFALRPVVPLNLNNKSELNRFFGASNACNSENWSIGGNGFTFLFQLDEIGNTGIWTVTMNSPFDGFHLSFGKGPHLLIYDYSDSLSIVAVIWAGLTKAFNGNPKTQMPSIWQDKCISG